MHKNALFFGKKWKNYCRVVLKPPLVDRELFFPSPVAVTFLQPFLLFKDHVITIDKEQKYLRNSNNVLLLSLISYFFATGSDFSALLEYYLYYLSYMSDG